VARRVLGNLGIPDVDQDLNKLQLLSNATVNHSNAPLFPPTPFCLE